MRNFIIAWAERFLLRDLKTNCSRTVSRILLLWIVFSGSDGLLLRRDLMMAISGRDRILLWVHLGGGGGHRLTVKDFVLDITHKHPWD